MTSVKTKKALLTSRPHRMPHVSRLRRVLASAIVRKRERTRGERKTVRSGWPLSVHAVGRKAYLRESTLGADELRASSAASGEGDVSGASTRGGAESLGGRG